MHPHFLTLCTRHFARHAEETEQDHCRADLRSFIVNSARQCQVLTSRGCPPLKNTVLSDEPYVNIEQAAAFLSVPVSFLHRNWKSAEVPCYRAGRRLKFKISELEAWLRERQA